MATLDMHGELCTWRLFTLRRHSGSADAPPRTAYGALLRDHNRQLVATLTSMNSAPSAGATPNQSPAYVLPLPGLYYLRVIATEQAEPLLQQGLRDVAAYMARQVEGAPASLNVSFDICMASATYAPTLGLAESVRLTSGSKEPQLCTPVLRLSEHQALDLSWYQLAKPQIWLWLLLDEIEALTPSIASVMNGGRSEVRDGSFIMASLMGKRHGPPTRNATLPNSPLLHLGALLPVQLLFYLVRHLLDEPERFPNLSVVGVTPLAMEHGPVLEVRVSASFPGSFLCPVQEAVGARLIQAFEQGRVMVHIPAFCPDQFTHPKAYTGCLRLFLPVATSALGLSFQDAVAIQPSGLLPNALERLQARTATGNGFDLRKICSLMLTGPRDLGTNCGGVMQPCLLPIFGLLTTLALARRVD